MTKTLLTVNEAVSRYPSLTGNKIRTLLSRGRLEGHFIDGRLHLELEQVENLVRRRCAQCLEYFTPADNRQIYCSKSCRQKASRGGLTKQPPRMPED